jgi:cell division protein FtsB
MIPQADDDPHAVPVEDRSAARRRARRQQIRERRRRYITVGLVVGLTSLLVNAIVGENGYLEAMRLRAEEADLRSAVAALRLENRQLQQDARRLVSDPAALEETARRDLGFIRPGEALVIIRDAAPADAAQPGR